MFESGAPRTSQVMIRLTAVERGYVVEEAAKAGVNMSEFLRSVLKRHLEKKGGRRAK